MGIGSAELWNCPRDLTAATGRLPIIRPSDPDLRVYALAPQSPDHSPSVTLLMAADMRQVDEVIQRRLASDVAMINQIAHYIISAGGKRIRPMLVLLFSSALGFEGKERFELAATVEFVHTPLRDEAGKVRRSALRAERQNL